MLQEGGVFFPKEDLVRKRAGTEGRKLFEVEPKVREILGGDGYCWVQKETTFFFLFWRLRRYMNLIYDDLNARRRKSKLVDIGVEHKKRAR